MVEADARELGHGSTVERAVVALAQAGVDMERDAAAGIRELGGLDGTGEVRGVDGGESAGRASPAQLAREVPPLLG